LLTLFTKKLGHAVWTGAAYAILWNTREESFLSHSFLSCFLPWLWGNGVSRHPQSAFSFLAEARRRSCRDPRHSERGSLFGELRDVRQLREIGHEFAGF
jgi:hypothetical protein